MSIRRVAIALAIMAAGCGGTDPGGVDAGPSADADVNAPDADPTVTTNLRFEFKADPHVPGEAGGTYNVYVSTVRIELADVRAIGDVTPGDATRRDSFVLEWTKSELEILEFRGAPPGLYSSLRGQVVSYRITGTVELTPGVQTGFVIDDAPSPTVSISTMFQGVRLDPGKTETVEVEVDVKDVLIELPWPSFDQGADPIVIDGGTSGIVDIRNDLVRAFEQES